VNKTERPKILPMKKQQVLKITLNAELSTELTQQNSLPSTTHELQFSDKQKLHSAPK
jgi:hypothetical protein